MESYSRVSFESIPELKMDASLLGDIHQEPSRRHQRALWLVKVTLHLSSLVIGILVGFFLSRARSGQLCDSHKFWRPSEFSEYLRKISRTRRQKTTAAGPHNPLLTSGRCGQRAALGNMERRSVRCSARVQSCWYSHSDSF